MKNSNLYFLESKKNTGLKEDMLMNCTQALCV